MFASARNPAALEGLRAADIECVQLDVTDAESVKAAVAQVLEAAGRIDVVFNNAGEANRPKYEEAQVLVGPRTSCRCSLCCVAVGRGVPPAQKA